MLCYVSVKSQDSLTYPVYFELNSAVIDSNEIKVLIQLFRNLDSFHVTDIKISAFCDERGGKIMNDKLSYERAKSIFTFIKEGKHIDSSIISHLDGMGYIDLVNEENIDEQRRQNRRGDLVIYYEKIQKSNQKKDEKKYKIADKPDEELVRFFKSPVLGKPINLKLLFSSKRSDLIGMSEKHLKEVVNLMKVYPYKIIIIGHIQYDGKPVDIDVLDLGTRTKNLSENRAKAARDFIVNSGIEAKRVLYYGMKANCPTGLETYLDRRVELEIIEQ